MLKAVKFGGSSVAGAEQFKKVKAIVPILLTHQTLHVGEIRPGEIADGVNASVRQTFRRHATYGKQIPDG